MQSEKDLEKYELARRLKSYIGRIRTSYMTDLKSEDEMVWQRATALFFIDKVGTLQLRGDWCIYTKLRFHRYAMPCHDVAFVTSHKLRHEGTKQL